MGAVANSHLCPQAACRIVQQVLWEVRGALNEQLLACRRVAGTGSTTTLRKGSGPNRHAGTRLSLYGFSFRADASRHLLTRAHRSRNRGARQSWGSEEAAEADSSDIFPAR